MASVRISKETEQELQICREPSTKAWAILVGKSIIISPDESRGYWIQVRRAAAAVEISLWTR